MKNEAKKMDIKNQANKIKCDNFTNINRNSSMFLSQYLGK